MAAVFFVVMAGTTLPNPLFELYEQRLGLSSLSVTAIYGVYALGVVSALAVLACFGSWLRSSTRLAVGLTLSAGSAVVYLLSTSVALLIAARVLSGLSAGLVSGTAASTMIRLADAHSRDRSALIALGTSFGGLAVGSALAGAMTAGDWALTPPFVVDLLACLAVAPGLLVVRSDPEDSAAPVAQSMHGPTSDGAESNLGRSLVASRPVRRLFVRAIVPAGAGFAANGLIAAIAAVFLAVYLHITDRALVGGLLATLFLATAAGQVAVKRTSPQLTPTVGPIGLIVGLALLAMTTLTPNLPGLIAACVIIGTSAGVCTGSGLVSIATAVPASQLTEATALYFVALYGSVTAPVIGDGLLARRIGLARASSVVSIALAIAVLAVLVRSIHAASGKRLRRSSGLRNRPRSGSRGTRDR